MQSMGAVARYGSLPVAPTGHLAASARALLRLPGRRLVACCNLEFWATAWLRVAAVYFTRHMFVQREGSLYQTVDLTVSHWLDVSCIDCVFGA